MNSRKNIIVVFLNPHHERSILFSGEVNELTQLNYEGEYYYAVESSFSGFHDWLQDGNRSNGRSKISGVELFPFDKAIHSELLAQRIGIIGPSNGVRVFWNCSQDEVISRGDQAFGWHQYFRSTSGKLAVALDVDDLSEDEFMDLRATCDE